MTIGVFLKAELVSAEGELVLYRVWPDEADRPDHSALFYIHVPDWRWEPALPKVERQDGSRCMSLLLPRIKRRFEEEGIFPVEVRYAR